jgi:hypothetical protein
VRLAGLRWTSVPSEPAGAGVLWATNLPPVPKVSEVKEWFTCGGKQGGVWFDVRPADSREEQHP